MSDTKLILTPDQAESLLPIGERVRGFVNPPWGFVECDCSRKDVVQLIREARLLEIGGERAKRVKHALVVHAREGGCNLFATDPSTYCSTMIEMYVKRTNLITLERNLRSARCGIFG